jgi:hypothetical protein
MCIRLATQNTFLKMCSQELRVNKITFKKIVSMGLFSSEINVLFFYHEFVVVNMVGASNF